LSLIRCIERKPWSSIIQCEFLSNAELSKTLAF